MIKTFAINLLKYSKKQRRMNYKYSVKFFLFSVCVHGFTVFTYIAFYGDLFLSFRNEILKEYDYVIVGAGTAGSVIAHRLSTETNYTYIVLEAGGHGNWVFDIPVLGPMLHGSIYDWQYETLPQREACLAMVGRKCRLPQGKIVGGSSKLNNMIHIRGNLSHYVSWFHGKYNEDFIRNQFEFIEQDIIQLDSIKYESELPRAMLNAAKELMYENVDVNSEFRTGFMKSKVSQKNGKRWATSNNIDDKNIVTNVLVEKVIIYDGNNARGVRFIHDGVKKEVYAKKAVILSSGTYNTPKILQLSGIGPTDVLKKHRIKVIKELPVGENLQDHVTTGLDLVHFDKSLKINPFGFLHPYNLYQYFIKGEGLLTTPGCEVVGFFSTKNESSPNIQFMVLPVGMTSDFGSHLRKVVGIKDEIWRDYFEKSLDKNAASIMPILLHPKSKGTVYINSSDPENPPLIDSKYLSDEQDVQTLIEGLKAVLDFVNTKAMKRIGAQINPIPFTGCEDYELFSELYWRCYVKHLTLTSYHPVGTCSMGIPTSKTTVVDTSFKVIGIQNLYVADGSVLPTLPSGNINAAIAMMASLFFETNILAKGKCRKKEDVVEYFLQVCFAY